MLSIRKLTVIGRTYRHLNRYRQILHILFKYGFGDILDILKIEQYIEVGLQMISKKRREQIEKLTRPERVRLAIEELGPTFIKLGQIMSTRPDVLPPDYIRELSKLQDEVPPFPYEEAREIIKEELGKEPDELFEFIEETPVAAASIGQVHRARLKSGDDVILKVQRPKIHKTIEIDLEILMHLAGLMEHHIEEMGTHRPTRIVDEFAHTLEREINYSIEASHIERFAHNFKDDPKIYVPKVYRKLTTERILTMEYIDGIKASNIERLKEEHYNLKEIARRGADSILKQVFVHGFFHADPHPGNVFIIRNNVTCYLDFGMMGRINQQEREDFSKLVFHVIKRNERKTVEAMLKLTTYDEEPDIERLEVEVIEFIDQHLYRPLKEIRVSRLLHHLLEILTRHKLRLKPNLFLMIKALGSVEGLGRQLDPDFDILGHAEPFMERIQMQRFHPKRIASEIIESASELSGLLRKIPSEVEELLTQTKKGKMGIGFEHRGLKPFMHTLERISNRVSFAIVLASLIIGSSLIVLSDLPPKWNEIPIIGLGGFIIAGIMGFWLLLSILRRGKL